MFTINGNIITCNKVGTTCLKIISTDTSAVTLVGIYVSKSTTSSFNLSPQLQLSNSNILIGSVSDDSDAATSFWTEIETTWLQGRSPSIPEITYNMTSNGKPINLMNSGTGKYCDMRYVYLNGGPSDNGWRYNYSAMSANGNGMPLGNRAIQFIENSFSYGMIPCLIYYNIPNIY